MAFETKRKIYEILPTAVKRFICMIPFGIIAGGAYRNTWQRNDYIDRASREEVLSYQENELGKMLRFAVKQVPAYQGYKKAVDSYPPFEALKEFPFLDKSALQENLQSYLPRNIEKIPHYSITTGGTSGSQLKLLVDDVSQSVETAFEHRLWKRVGYTPKSRKATFRGVAFPNLRPGEYWQLNPIYNEMQFSPFHLSEETIVSYVKKLKQYKPIFIHGYPSALDMMSKYILKHELKDEIPEIKSLFLVSEGFTIQQRNRIENAFSSRVFSFYGHSERVILGGECEKNHTYHHFPDYGVLEIISDDGKECNKEGDYGQLIGTGLLNKSLPLIRYKTGDYATRLISECECGRKWDRFTNVVGRRNHDMIRGKNGTNISITALNMHGNIFDKVIRYQYVQNRVGACKLCVMAHSNFGRQDRIAIEKAHRLKTQEELDLMVEVVDDIPLTKRGKLKILVSNV